MIEKYDIKETFAFTGHRLIESSKVNDLRKALRANIKALYAKGIRIYLSGMALGFDMIAAEEVIALKEELPSLRLVAVIPFQGQNNRWSYRDKQRYSQLLAAADDSVVLSEGFFKGCYLKRNDFMIDHSCGIMAYFDGGYKGGTFYTFRQAKIKGKDIINLY